MNIRDKLHEIGNKIIAHIIMPFLTNMWDCCTCHALLANPDTRKLHRSYIMYKMGNGCQQPDEQ